MVTETTRQWMLRRCPSELEAFRAGRADMMFLAAFSVCAKWRMDFPERMTPDLFVAAAELETALQHEVATGPAFTHSPPSDNDVLLPLDMSGLHLKAVI